MVVLNVDVEKLGDYIDRGRYRNTEDAPMLLIFDKDMQTMVYSDEYRLLRGENDMQELQTLVLAQGDTFTTTGDLWGKGYVISGMISSDDNLRYLYLSTTQAFDDQCRDADQRLLLSVAVICLICLMLASLLAAWVYRPIRKTVKLLSDMSMLTEWDRKEHMDEIEAIQRSIVQAKKQRDDMDEEIQERMVSLHNAQICALQTQINPHFLFNTLESIGNASALLMGGENQVTDMIYTLSKMMRLSLSNEKLSCSVVRRTGTRPAICRADRFPLPGTCDASFGDPGRNDQYENREADAPTADRKRNPTWSGACAQRRRDLDPGRED